MWGKCTREGQDVKGDCFLPPKCEPRVYSRIITMKLESICNHLSSTIFVKRGGKNQIHNGFSKRRAFELKE